MKISKILTALAASALLCSCSSDGGGLTKAEDKGSTGATSSAHAKVDYSKGRAMNARLGKGINLGNAWDGAAYWSCGTLTEGFDLEYVNLNGESKSITLASSDQMFFNNLPASRYNSDCADKLDASWSNPIPDDYFTLVKQAGFNSIRLPVRWQHNSDPVTHKVNPERLAGVMEDIQLAVNAGLAVVVSFHWYYEIMFAANHAKTHPDLYEAELFHFISLWSEVATALNIFPDDMIVFDILNEPTMSSVEKLNEVMNAGYQAIRAAAPGKTIMFESKQSAKFAEITNLELPADGNIIYSGHYYEPYGFTHQGHSYACRGDAAYSMTANNDLKTYAATVKKLYPDVVAGLYLPMNMGEFGVSGGESANRNSCKSGENPPTNAAKARWAQGVIAAAEALGISWHYWGLAGVGGFEAYDKKTNTWLEGFPAAFGL
ncbi:MULTISPECIES: glycoside hydrolase family 5 protein [unclassified Fibrobacter]|uniref:glycoside hydrolase family 5 protein n=1 Tax=unclassified Fibrobacter TaxID=2634177 RepID=UPI000D6A8BA8|nr:MULTISPECIES: cellulase family glycosylhydrolase [unclassified Fibrobacter]PWJ69003.1 endoglucanase [Fibrobacter sp. UWR4]PZW70849.1 endoglucanase [Fibrobacter sp. UWR1]